MSYSIIVRSGTHIYTVIFYRVMKQALKASGANGTERHMREISMCGLFLLEAAKKADHEFQTSRSNSHHAVRSAEDDISKMTTHLLEEKFRKSV